MLPTSIDGSPKDLVSETMSPSPLRHPARMAGASLLRLQSDERLAELAAGGHEAAFDAIVDRYRTPLTRYCSGLVGPSRAEDAAQQALINAHDALQRTDEVRHLRSWLYRIAHNAALNVLRAVRDDVSLDDATAGASALEAAPGGGPAEAFEASERFRATVAALRELPERQRAALVLRELEGRSHEEIAEALGVTKGSARQHLMRGRVAIRGAVTAITPYPLIVRLAEMLASPGAPGWTDAAVGAGAGATLAKLTAGVVATGALVGGAVGTERVVHHHGSATAAERSSAGAATKTRAVKARVVSLPPAVAGNAGSSASGSGRGASGSDDARGKDDRRKGSSDRGHDGSSGKGSGSGGQGSDDAHGSRGSDDSPSTSGSHGSRGGSGSTSGNSGRGSSGSDDGGSSASSGRGSGSKDSGSGSGDSGRTKGSGSGSSSSGNGSGGSGSGSTSSNSGSGGSGDGTSGSSSQGSSKGSGGDTSSGSGRDTSEDTTTTPLTGSTPTVATSPTTTTPSSGSGSSGSGSGSGDRDTSGSDGSGSSDRSGSN
jgi:RNA polymerase sigma factor (sigma-70 family)